MSVTQSERPLTINKTAHSETTKAFLHRCRSSSFRAPGGVFKCFQLGTGPIVVVVHDIHSDLGSMLGLTEDLSSNGYKVVLFDLPAHGEAAGTCLKPQQVSAFLRKLGSRLGHIHAAIGHGVGGLWALEALGEDFSPARLVLLGPPADRPGLPDCSLAQAHGQIRLPGLVIHGQEEAKTDVADAPVSYPGWPGATIELVDGVRNAELVQSWQARKLVAWQLRQSQDATSPEPRQNGGKASNDWEVRILETMLELREVDRDQEMLEQTVKVPVSAYTDVSVLQRELSTVFRNSPLVVGHAAQVREPGSYILSPWKKLPFVVVRDKQGELRAFLNVCRHRGAQLVSGTEEKLRAFVCPFHGWVYGLDGRLQGLPRRHNFPDLDCAQHDLRPLAVEERLGFVWLHPTPGKKPQALAALGETISNELEQLGLDQMLLHRRSVTTLRGNWKLLIKTYLERYHVPILHKKSIGPVFEKGVIVHHEHGPHIRLAAAKTNLPEARNADRATWRILDYASVFYTLFPNTFLINHSNLASLNSFYPVDAGTTIWTHDMLYRAEDYAGEKGQQHLAERFEYISGVFHREDFGIIAGIQDGLESGVTVNESHLLGLEEGLLAMFQRSVDQGCQVTDAAE